MTSSTVNTNTQTIMMEGYKEVINSHLASARRSKNRNAEIALERITAAISSISIDALLARGTNSEGI
jgi:hypothetical protein